MFKNLRINLLTLFALLPLLILTAQDDCAGGRLTLPDGGTTVNVCFDREDDAPIDVVLTGAEGETIRYFVTNAGGYIVDAGATEPPFDLSGLRDGAYLIFSVSYSGRLVGTDVGDNYCDFSSTGDCLALSNPIVVQRQRGRRCEPEPCETEGGMIALASGSTDTTICISTPPNPLEVVRDGEASGEEMTFIITDNQSKILAIPAGNGPFDLTSAGTGTCLIYYLSYDGDIDGLEVGNTPDDFEGCFALSNPIRVERNAGADCDGAVSLYAYLNGTQELPCPVTTTGHGAVNAVLTGNVLTFSGSFEDLESDFDANVAGGAHLHLGMAGMGGPIAFRLTTDLDDDLRGGEFEAEDNTFELTDEQVDAFLARRYYVNIHTTDHPAGEIRGQLLRASDGYLAGILTGANEVPAIVTTAYGGVAAEIEGNTLTVSGSFAGLTGDLATDIAGGAHLHLGSAGRNGPVVFSLTMNISDDARSATFPAASNAFELTDEQLAAFRAGMYYVNVHSRAFPSGELRAQLLPYAVTTFYANASGYQARPMPVDTDGSGRLLLNLDEDGDLTAYGSIDGLSAPIATDIAGGAHLHLGLPGQSGPVAFVLGLDIDDDQTGAIIRAADNVFEPNDEQIQAFYDRGYYANFHTTAVTSGEIRGQALNLAKAYFGANLAGVNQNPDAVKTGAGGFVLHELCGDRLVSVGSFAGLESDYAANIAGGSHLHAGNAASNGPIVVGLDADVADDLRSGTYPAEANVITVDEATIQAILAGGVYVNVHSVDNPSGEIRGQVLSDDNAFPAAPELGDEPGSFAAAEDPDGDLVVYRVEIAAADDEDFEELIVCAKLGTATNFDDVLSALRDSLIADGAEDGDAFEFRYRVFASDGSVSTPSETETFEIEIEEECDVDGGMLALAGGGDEITICAGDGESDDFDVELTGAVGSNFTYVITDSEGNILGLPAAPPFNLDGAGPGVCLLWALSFEDGLEGAEVGMNADNLEGCYDLSNPITVNRNDPEPGTISLAAGGTEATICVDTPPNPLDVIMTDNTRGDAFTFVVTDDSGVILAIPVGNGPFDLSSAGAGTCLIYHLASYGELDGLETGEQLGELEGCFELSNAITVTRNAGADCEDRDPDATFIAVINGLQELPCPVTTTGYGTATASLTGNTLTVAGEFEGLTSDFNAAIAGGAHLHIAAAGMGGGVAFRLTTDLDDDLRGGEFDEDDNTFELTDEQVTALNDGLFYINIHTVDYPGGEIRGQVLPAGADAYLSSPLLGVYEVPSVTTPASGGVVATLVGNTLSVSGGFSGLMDTIATSIAGGAHIHMGAAGRNGGVIFPLTMNIMQGDTAAVFPLDDNVFELTDEQVAAALSGGLYVNIHSGAVPSGELRGQLANHFRVTSFLADLSGHQELPEPVDTEASGKVIVDVAPDGESVIAYGSFDDLSAEVLTDLAGGAHIHFGLAGQSGPVIFPIALQLDEDRQGAVILPGDNAFDVEENQLTAFYDRGYYVNVHTPTYQSGEIRGQVLNLAKGYFGSNLSGYAANPLTPSDGTGFIAYEYNVSSFTATGAFATLDSEFNADIAGGSHLHVGDADETGPIAVALVADPAGDLLSGVYEAEANTFDLTAEQAEAFTSGGLYFNLHTDNYPAGEIRGQVLRLDNAFPDTSKVLSPEDDVDVVVFPDELSIDDALISSSEDPDGDLVFYIVEFAVRPDVDFISPLAAIRLGTDTSFTTALTSIYDTLLAVGVPPGASLDINYRISASDGSVFTPGMTMRANITLGVGQQGFFLPVINEVSREGQVELLNVGNRTASLADYRIAVNGELTRLGDLNPDCGNMTVKPGEITTFSINRMLSKATELALFSDGDLSDPRSMVSYFAWGDGERSYEELASAAGFSANEAIGSPDAGMTIQRFDEGGTIDYALAAETLCAPNQATTSVSGPAGDILIAYPNPVADQLTIEYGGLRADRTQLLLIDANGRIVSERMIDGRDGRLRIALDRLPAGSYLIRMTNEAGTSISRIVKN